MADKRILQAEDIVSLLAADVVPVERSGDSTAFKATLQEILNFIFKEGFVIPAAGGDSDWRFYVGESIFNGMPDQVFKLGINIGGDDPAVATFLIGLESDYYTGETEHVSEYYVEWTAADGSPTLRPLHILVDYLTETSHIVINGASTFRSSDATPDTVRTEDGEWQYDKDGTFATGKGPVLRSPDGTKYRIKVANGGALSTEVVS